MINVKQLTKTYGRKATSATVLKEVTFDIPRATTVAIVGKSGSGKSTLMHLMSGLDHPSGGQVLINSEDIFKMKQKKIDQFRSEKIGFIFQSFFVQGAESCYDNVSLPLEIARVPYRKRKAKVQAALDAVELGDRAKQKAKNLSGGQKQRLAIARAIVNEPKILFADEPTGNLDSVTGEKIETLLFDYAKKHHATLIIVTHDHDLAKKCDMRIGIKDGEIVSIDTKSQSKGAKQ
jgi:putative ABC transport system ATP-binding protein